MLEDIVFYADDDVDDIDLLTDAFAYYSKKIKLITAFDGQSALVKLNELKEKKCGPCLIILDINMPYISGKDVLKQLRKMDFYSETPIILFSTSNSPQEKEMAKKYNSVLITKPVNLGHLNSIVDEFIEYCHD